jgi:hypothetical protein
MSLHRSYGQIVAEGHSEIIGVGDSSVLRYATDLLVHPLSTVAEAQVIGSYMVRLANRYIDGCGGGPDIAALLNDGKVLDGNAGCFHDEESRFAYCEKEVGRTMKELLLSGGTLEALTRLASQKSEGQQ